MYRTLTRPSIRTHSRVSLSYILAGSGLACLWLVSAIPGIAAADTQSPSPPADATGPTGAGAIDIGSRIFTLRLDKKTGAPIELVTRAHRSLSFGSNGWWALTMEDNSVLRPADCTATVTRTGSRVECRYTSSRAEVDLEIIPGPNTVELRSKVKTGTGTVKRLALPADLTFDPAATKGVYFPFELGRKLQPSFFQAQPEDRTGKWSLRAISAEGARLVGIHPTEMRDYDEIAVKASVTPEGQAWLGDAARAFEGWMVRCPRPPAVKPDVTLLETSSGPLLSLERIEGGKGWFVRWGGVFNGEDYPRVLRACALLARTLWENPNGPGSPASAGDATQPVPRSPNIGVIDLGMDASSRDWDAALQIPGCQVRNLKSPAAILQALQSRECWMIVNPDGEILPAVDAAPMAAAIHSYVVGGGVWVHTGGAPFFYALQPEPYLSVRAAYPPAFSDFMHLDMDGPISVFVKRDPAQIFVPAELEAAGKVDGGHLSHEFITWVDPGAAWEAPVVVLQVGQSVQDALQSYAKANGFVRPLASKIQPAILEKLKRCVLLKYNGGSYQDKADLLALLPKPLLIHDTDYLHGGFDKQYPDQLPPNPAHGTPEEFAGFIRKVHEMGGLFMPYTNPTWWCDGPPGPSLVREGTAPLLKDRAGKPVKEVYAANYGWSLCAFYPAAMAAEKQILNGFTRDYPSDVLFQDQIGARSSAYDFNPASPTPYAYIQGMLDIAQRDGKVIPLGTENGFDAAMNAETLFCGIVWGLVPTQYGPTWTRLWRDIYPSGTWQFAPMALWLGHDKILFGLHDLGQFVTNRETLAWTLALGYQLSLAANVNGLRQEKNREWLAWLSALENVLGPRILGAPLLRWNEISPGVFSVQYGSVDLTSNTNASPYPLDPETTLSPYGFYAVDHGPDPASAGSLDRFEGKDYTGGTAFIRHGSELIRGPEAATPGISRTAP